MSVDYKAFADFSSNLLTSDSEIDWRMSAARAYYASYHRALLSVHHCPDNSHLVMGSHERITERLQLYGTPGAKSIAYILRLMKKVRHNADYEIDDPFEKCAAVNQLEQHKALVQRLDAFDAMVTAKSA